MRLLVLLIPLALGGCLSFSSSNPQPAPPPTVVVQPSAPTTCPNGSVPPCQ